MNGSVDIGKIFGVPLRLHWSAPVLVALLGYGLGRYTLPLWAPGYSRASYALAALLGAVLLLAALLVHEATHAGLARRAGIAVEDVTLWALGGVTRMGRAERPRTLLLVSVGGPVASLLSGGVALGLGVAAHALHGPDLVVALLGWLCWANLLLGVFNLLPAAPLDGGRVLQALVWWRTGDRERAVAVADRAGQAVGALLVVYGLVSVLAGASSGVWAMLLGVFITASAGSERRRADLEGALRGVRVGDAMSAPVDTGPDWFTIDRFLAEVAARHRRSALPLLDFDARPSGLAVVRRIAAVPPRRRPEVRVRDVAVPLARCATAAPEEPLLRALARCTPETGTRLLVLDPDDGRLIGIVTGSDITRRVRQREPRPAGVLSRAQASHSS